MRLIILCVCLPLICLSQRPQPCTSPPLLTGRMSVTTADTKLMVYAKYSYDALGQRLRLREFGTYNNKTFHIDLLFLYKEAALFEVDYMKRTCKKRPLHVDFQPFAIPQNATLLDQVVLGSSSGLGQGVLVNTWLGERQTKEGEVKYMSTFTEFGCIPVSVVYHSDRSGWVLISFFNNVLGLVDPDELIPPSFCNTLEKDDDQEPVAFFNLF